ncbi:MAG: flagellar export chaperone FliS [Succinivibrio sp.]|nr:flagellar export chaperone FliS [Succinivibrio sp.]
MYGRKLNAYRQTNLQAEISVADPYIVTKMLYQGVFERLAQAKGAIMRGDLATKAKKLATASTILENLKSTLDFSINKDLAQSLYDIYSYMLDKIADATIEVSCKPIDEAVKIFMPIKQAWDSLPMSARQEANERRTEEQRQDQQFRDGAMTKGSI